MKLIYKIIMLLVCILGYYLHIKDHRQNIKDNTQISMLNAIDNSLWAITYIFMVIIIGGM